MCNQVCDHSHLPLSHQRCFSIQDVFGGLWRPTRSQIPLPCLNHDQSPFIYINIPRRDGKRGRGRKWNTNVSTSLTLNPPSIDLRLRREMKPVRRGNSLVLRGATDPLEASCLHRVLHHSPDVCVDVTSLLSSLQRQDRSGILKTRYVWEIQAASSVSSCPGEGKHKWSPIWIVFIEYLLLALLLTQ